MIWVILVSSPHSCSYANFLNQDAVWQLIGLSNWIIGLLERIMKECIIFRDIPEKEKMDETQDDLFGPPSGWRAIQHPKSD